MGKTITEKILARASGRPSVEPGDLIVARPHVVAFHDAVGSYLDWFEKHDLRVWDPQRVIFCFDHFFHSWMQGGSVTLHPRIREFARKQGIPPANIYDVGRHGLLHQIPAEEGWALPGTLYIGADTQSATMGALACVAFTRAGEVHTVAATGETWVRVPSSIQLVLHGQLPKGLLGKDVFLRLMRDLREAAVSQVLEFTGPGVESLSVDNRMAIANGSALMGTETMIFPPDRRVLEFVEARAREPFQPVTSDPDAEYSATYTYDLGEFGPLVSAHPAMENIQPLEEVAGLEVNMANIGSCASARLEDLALAAQVLRGRKVHPRVRLIVTPISSNVLREALRLGFITALVEAGATITTPGCGACYLGNQSPGVLGAGEVCITSSTENGPGRMGSKDARIYIGNAAVVAASAVEGCIADPRPYLNGRLA